MTPNRPRDIIDELEEMRPGLMRAARQRSKAKAIRAKCHDCANSTGYAEIKTCPVVRCPLWPYRLGTGFEDPGLPIPAVDAEKSRAVKERLAR